MIDVDESNIPILAEPRMWISKTASQMHVAPRIVVHC